MSNKLSDLVPAFRDKVDLLISNCAAKGVRIVPINTLRSPHEQARLWRQSRSKAEVTAAIEDLRSKGAPFLADVLDGVGPQYSKQEVTRALPGSSWHQWGEAIDFSWEVDGKLEDSETRKVDGVNGYKVMADEAIALGLDAGFYWRSLKDGPHVQLRSDANPLKAGIGWPEIDRTMRERFGGGSAAQLQSEAVGAIGAVDPIVPSFQSENGWTIYETKDVAAAVFRAKMAIDADGSPQAYSPEKGKGLDYLANAGRPGNWWALVTDGNGEPLIQKSDDLAPGYYISSTSLKNVGHPDTTARRYIDSGTIPYFVLPGKSFSQFTHGRPIRLGDLGVVYNIKTGLHVFAIFADTGPAAKIGEGSMALARAVGLKDDPKRGGGTDNRDIVYVVFPGSGIGQGMPVADIEAKAKPLFEAWGGLGRIAGYGKL